MSVLRPLLVFLCLCLLSLASFVAKAVPAALPTVSVAADVRHVEGDAGTSVLNFTINLSAASEDIVIVDYATSTGGTATSGSDYTGVGGRLTFYVGETSKTIGVIIKGDTTVEFDETFTLILSQFAGAVLGKASGVGTIVNDDTAIPEIILLSPSSVLEGDSGTTPATFTLTLSGAHATTVVVDVETIGAEAAAQLSAFEVSDFTRVSRAIQFLPGERSKTFTVLVNGDQYPESDERFGIRVSSATEGFQDQVRTDEVNVYDDDDSVKFEGSPDSDIPSGKVAVAYSQSFSSSGGFGAYSYDLFDGSLPKGLSLSTTGKLSGTPTEDGTFSFKVRVRDSSPDDPYNDERSYAYKDFLLIIYPADVLPPTVGVVVADPDLRVGETSAVTFTFSAPVTGFDKVDLTVANGTLSTVASGDGGVTWTAIFTPTASLADDTNVIVVDMNGVVDAKGTAGVGTQSSNNYAIDTLVRSLTINDVGQAEGNAGTSMLNFTVSLNQASTQSITAAYASSDGTASAGSDYVGSSGTLTFNAGETSKTIAVTINGDTTVEADETFNLTLSSPTVAVLGDASGVGTISNDDQRVLTLTPSNFSQSEGNTGTTAVTFTVFLSNPSPQTVTVAYAVSNGTAIKPSDYGSNQGTLSFSPGADSRTITVLVNGDVFFEADETIIVTLSAPSGAVLGNAVAQATIVNDDVPTSISPATLPAAALSVPYNRVLGASPGVGLFTFSLTAGSLPPGLTLSAGGTLSGSPTQAGGYIFTVKADDSMSQADGGPNTASRTYEMIIPAPAQVPTLSVVGDASQAEGNTGISLLNFTVRLNQASTGTVTVAYATSDGTGTAGSDYLATSGTLTFNAGETSKAIAITVNGDTTVEADETFNITLSAPSAAVLGDALGVGTIGNDDVPVITISPTTTTLPSGLVGAVYSQQLSGSGGTAPYSFALSAGTLPAGLSLSRGGLLSGTATATGNPVFTVTTTDASTGPGAPFQSSQVYTFSVGPAPKPVRKRPR